MKTTEEIRKMAVEMAKKVEKRKKLGFPEFNGIKYGFRKGYAQCQKDAYSEEDVIKVVKLYQTSDMSIEEIIRRYKKQII